MERDYDTSEKGRSHQKLISDGLRNVDVDSISTSQVNGHDSFIPLSVRIVCG